MSGFAGPPTEQAQSAEERAELRKIRESRPLPKVTGVRGDDVTGYVFEVEPQPAALSITPAVQQDTGADAGEPAPCCVPCGCPVPGSGITFSGVGGPTRIEDVRWGPDSDWAGWWFAEECDESDGGSATHRWRPRLQLPDMALALDGVWFASQEECLGFIRDNVLPRAGATDA
jgi:hypothetical protein